MNWYRVSSENTRWRLPDVTASLRGFYKRASALGCWIAIALLILIVLRSLAAEKAQPFILLAGIGVGMLLGDKVAQFAHEFLGVLTERWRARPPSAYFRRHTARPRTRLKGVVLGGILAAGLWYTFQPAQSTWLSGDAFVIAIAKAERSFRAASERGR